MNKEIDDEYNERLKYLSSTLYELRSIEFDKDLSISKKYKKAKPLLKGVTNYLYEEKDYLALKPFWIELHDRMVYYYDYLNEINLTSDRKIPLFRTTLHNEAVHWWLQCKNMGRIKGPLVHFDTHSDMGMPESSEQLLKKDKTNKKSKQLCIDEDGIASGSCGQINWPVTCILLSKAIDHVIWAMPKWIYDNNARYEQTLVCKKETDEFVFMRNADTNKKDKFFIDEEVEYYNDGEYDSGDYKFEHDIIFDRIKVFSISGWRKLGKSIESDRFILDIDLDFFVTNGDKYSKKEYMTEFWDMESTGRVHTNPGITMPRMVYSDDLSLSVAKELNKEWKKVVKRIDIFLNGLEYLKSNGIIPCCINFSDSTESFFSGNIDRAVLSNSYTPKYFVPGIHMLLYKGFIQIYGKNKFI